MPHGTPGGLHSWDSQHAELRRRDVVWERTGRQLGWQWRAEVAQAGS